jgi:pyruvate dehydrogenase E2 component (dihydrolipoamide acetyltransferase)
MADVTMPRLSDSMEEGTVVRWLRSDGDAVGRGDEIVEVETDKATMTYEAPDDGVLHVICSEGDTLPVGAVMAQVLAEGEAASPVAIATATHSGARLKASPVARRIARDAGLSLEAMSGTGPGGRIVKADVTAALERPAAEARPSSPATPAPAPADAGSRPSTGRGDVIVHEPTRSQQVVARRMAEAKATVPEFTVQIDIDMEEALALRARLVELTPEGRRPPSINDMVVKACALALRDHPGANAAFIDGQFHLYSRVNVGIAVAGPDLLVVPTIFDADCKSLGEIARETGRLAAKVRDATVTPAELAGGTFTVSNLGMYGTSSFTAVINAPQAAILAVGAVGARAVVRDGAVRASHTMTATMTCDHRVLYGADAAALLSRIRELLESPLSIAV